MTSNRRVGRAFSYSARERRIAGLIEVHKTLRRAYLARLGNARLRECFAANPLGQRVRVGGMWGCTQAGTTLWCGGGSGR